MNEANKTIALSVTDNDNGRLDNFLAANLDGKTRSYIKNLIEKGNIYINDIQAQKAGTKIKSGDIIKIEESDDEKNDVEPENIPLNIIYEDEDIALINKPQGMVVHPAPGNYTGTLVNAALYHFNSLSDNSGCLRPGIVHRLDKDTSGLIIIAKNNEAHEELSRRLNMREIKKKYIALVHGNIKEDKGTVRTNIGRHPKDRKKMAVTRLGREAVTHFKVLERFDKYTLVEFTIETGRTHQIRVHSKHIGHPIVGDPVYTKLKDPFKLNGQLLHAARLEFDHPVSGEKIALDAPLPDYFDRVIDTLKQEEES